MSKGGKHKAWVLTVDMGYGHQRAAYPLKHLSQNGIITANNYKGIPKRDKQIWEGSREFYEFISRFKKIPIIGEKAFSIFDKLQTIPKFYPKRDLSKSIFQVNRFYDLFDRFNWGKHLIDKMAEKPVPIITTFFTTAMMADYYDYPGEIYCLPTDTDVSRSWVPPEPKKSQIIYLAPTKRVKERLKLYGVRPSKIYLTGFPLPECNVGQNLSHLKYDLGRRLIQLDPDKVFLNQYDKTLGRHIGKKYLRKRTVRPLTITFCVGGAGAQREIGVTIVNSLSKEIKEGKIRMNLVAGTHSTAAKFFKDSAKEAGLTSQLNKGVSIIYNKDKYTYFDEFNKILRETDILWTKPSEMSFYCALGIPIIMAPPIGSQEFYNQDWLRAIGAGISQLDPRYANEWLTDWLKSGWLAEAAIEGFLEAPRFGTYNVEKMVFHQYKQAKKMKTVLQY